LYNIKFEKEGLDSLQKELHKLDPEYFEICDNQNPVRLIRALEVIKLSGKKMSEQHKHKPKERNFQCHHLIMDWPREKLYERINARVDLMMASGLVEEVKTLLHYREKNALQTVGYQEIFAFLDGQIDINRAVALIKQNSRRYAKRQITWSKRNADALWVKPEEFDNPGQLMEQMGLSQN
jgi:tRNA dimethylallyltransferase